jgi:uncharacterized protein
MASVEAGSLIAVEVHHSPAPREVQIVKLSLPQGSTVADALRASGVGLAEDLSVGVWGRLAPLDTALREADRVEVCRGLLVDPKEARRLRYRGQPAKKKPGPAVRRAPG